MVKFSFEFDKPDKKYKAGETVLCKITIELSEKLHARSLSIRFKGIAHTEWTKIERIRRRDEYHNVRTKYTGDEEYFRNYQCV